MRNRRDGDKLGESSGRWLAPRSLCRGKLRVRWGGKAEEAGTGITTIMNAD